LQAFLKKMMNSLDSTAKTLVVLGTGGTIAGTASSADDHTGYTAAQLSVAHLLGSVPGLEQALAGARLESEQVAQLDSKDMDFSTLARLAQRCVHHLQRTQVAGIVVTHGTDTLEETAYFLHLVLYSALPEWMARKAVVLTCAMRPATSSEADGPRNLRDAVGLALDQSARGVLALCAGDVHHAALVQKVHSFALNAFSSGVDAQGRSRVLAKVQVVQMQEAQVQSAKIEWNTSAELIYEENSPVPGIKSSVLATKIIALLAIVANGHSSQTHWPRVEIVLNHAQQDGHIVRALLAASSKNDPLRGLIVAGTGNGTVSADLQRALDEAAAQGVKVEMVTRCVWDDMPGIQAAQRQMSKARIRLTLSLL
jgi:L-asparaginase